VRTLPEARQRGIARGVARGSLALRRLRARRHEAKIAAFFADRPELRARARSLLLEIVASHVEETMALRRLGVDPGWRPRVELHGADAVEAARGGGGGVVLWLLPQVLTPLLAQLTAHDRGWDLLHLRHWTHGGGHTRLGRRLVGRRNWRIEERHLRTAVITPQGPTSALRAMLRHLRRGGVGSVVGIAISDAPVTLPLLGGRVVIARGAPWLAQRAGASLFAVRGEPPAPGDTAFALHFERLPRPAEAGDEDPLRPPTEAFASVLARALETAPALWPVNWRTFRV